MSRRSAQSTGDTSRHVWANANAPHRPRWARLTLIFAAIYDIVWGGLVVLAPNTLFNVLEMATPRYVGLWQCIGMIVGVYGVGYFIAAFNPARHWPIVLVGLLGKIFGPTGFLLAAARGELPWRFGVTIITNDLIWIVPFVSILRLAYRVNIMTRSDASPTQIDLHHESLETALSGMQTNTGQSLLERSREQPQLVVFLRHTGCTFCREALGDIARRRAELEQSDVGLVLVHMSPDDQAKRVFSRYGLEDLPRISDPDQHLYRQIGLQRGTFGQLFGPKMWWRGIVATLRGHVLGRLIGDGFQMPGVFLIDHGRIVRAYRHQTAADRPDYTELACDTPAS